MSWDIFIQDLPDVTSVEDIPEDFRPGTIGEREVIVARLRNALPFLEHQEGAGVVEPERGHRGRPRWRA